MEFSKQESTFNKKSAIRIIALVAILLVILLAIYYAVDSSSRRRSFSVVHLPIIRRNTTVVRNDEEENNSSRRIDALMSSDENNELHQLFTVRGIDRAIPSSPQSPTIASRPRRKPKILFWTSFFGNANFGTGTTNGDALYRDTNCPFICDHTASKDDWLFSDAILFHLRDDYMPLPPDRDPLQKWVFFTLESPVNQRVLDNSVDEVFDWTMTYSIQSDVWIPYGGYKRRQKPIPLKTVSLEGKKLAAWLVSNCVTSSLRVRFFDSLSFYVEIDKFGHCGGGQCEEKREECYAHMGETYLFYLSFENSLCEDYITEKLWLALAAGMVPIVYGGADYKRFLPPHSFIDATSFNSAKELSATLQFLSTNITAYQEYLQWNEHFEIDSDASFHGWCRLCQKLHEEQQYPTKSKVKISQFWSTERLCANKNAEMYRLLSITP